MSSQYDKEEAESNTLAEIKNKDHSKQRIGEATDLCADTV